MLSPHPELVYAIAERLAQAGVSPQKNIRLGPQRTGIETGGLRRRVRQRPGGCNRHRTAKASAINHARKSTKASAPVFPASSPKPAQR